MFWNVFYKLCHDRHKSPNGVAKELNISSGAITSWKNGKVPHHTTLLKLSEYFGVSIDYLLGKSETPSPAALSFTEEENAIISALRAQPEMKPAVLRLLGLDSGSE